MPKGTENKYLQFRAANGETPYWLLKPQWGKHMLVDYQQIPT